MGYADLNGIHNPTTGGVPPVAWGDQIRDNFEWLVDPPRCKLTGFPTTCGTGNFTTLDNGVEVYDVGGFHTGTSNQMVVPSGLAGTYMLGARASWDYHDTGPRNIGLYLNGTDSEPFAQGPAAAGTVSVAAPATVQSGVLIFELAVGDTIALRGRQGRGGNLDCTSLEFWLRWWGR
jgi:hypothetical protein